MHSTSSQITGMRCFLIIMEVVFMVKVTLKDDVVKEFQSGTTVMDIAKSIGMGLYKD